MTGLTSGPWSGKDPYRRTTWTLTLAEVTALLRAVPNRPAMLAALGDVGQLGDRKTDRALQLLRRARLIRWTGKGWERTELGDQEAAKP
jgi:hypothetical protein